MIGPTRRSHARNSVALERRALGRRRRRRRSPERARTRTDGFGVDAVIITAATSSERRSSRDAFQACRRKGRVVIVGDVGLDLKRPTCTRRSSTSSCRRRTAPAATTRSTRTRAATTRSATCAGPRTATWRSTCDCSPTAACALDAPAARALPGRRRDRGVRGAAARDGEQPTARAARVPRASATPARTRQTVRTVAAAPRGSDPASRSSAPASFAQGDAPPEPAKLRRRLRAPRVMSRTGSTAKARRRARTTRRTRRPTSTRCSRDDDVDLVLISTRHDLHAPLALAALARRQARLRREAARADEDELAAIEAFYARAADGAAADDRLQPPLLARGPTAARARSPAGRRRSSPTTA